LESSLFSNLHTAGGSPSNRLRSIAVKGARSVVLNTRPSAKKENVSFHYQNYCLIYIILFVVSNISAGKLYRHKFVEFYASRQDFNFIAGIS